MEYLEKLKILNLLRMSGLLILCGGLLSCGDEAVDWIDIPLAENVFFEERPEFRTDVIEIPLFALQDLEYKLDMKQGGAVSYHWEANNLPDSEELLTEFHGHTIREAEAPGDLMFYRVGRGDSYEGYLVAPWDGIHGWYFSNESNQDITIMLTVSGFYSLVEQ